MSVEPRGTGKIFIPVSPADGAVTYGGGFSYPLLVSAFVAQCRLYIEGDENKPLLLAQANGVASVLAPLLSGSVMHVGAGRAAFCTQLHTWAVGSKEATKHALVRFLREVLANACHELFLKLGKEEEPKLAAALQTIHAGLAIDEKLANGVAEQLVLRSAIDTWPLDVNATLLAGTGGELYQCTWAAAVETVVTVRPIQPADCIRRTLGYRIPAEAADAAALEAVVHAALPDQADVRRFWAHALATIAFAPAHTDRQVFVLLGEARSGKTTLITMLRHLFGEYAVALSDRLFYGKKFTKNAGDAEAMAGARLAYVDDPTAEVSVELLKRLTNRDSGVCCQLVIAAQEAKFRAALGTAAASIGGRVKVLTLPKQFVPPHQHSAENDSAYPLAKSNDELDQLFRVGAPLLMRKLLLGDVSRDAARLYHAEQTTLPRCDRVQIDTQRLLEPTHISDKQCVAKWLDDAMLKAPGAAQPLLIRNANATVAVSVLFAHYTSFVDARRRNALAVPPNAPPGQTPAVAAPSAPGQEPAVAAAAEVDDNDDDDYDPGQQQGDENGPPAGSAGKRKAAASSSKVEKKQKKKVDKHEQCRRAFLKLLEQSKLDIRVANEAVIGYAWTGQP
jgi:hypothetical protein